MIHKNQTNDDGEDTDMANVIYTSEELERRVRRAAKEVFLEKTIDNAEMNEIAARAEISRSTLYRFAKDKVNLAYMIALDVVTDLSGQIMGYPYEGNGFEKLSQSAARMIDVYTSDISALRFLSDFDRQFSSAVPLGEISDNYEKEMRRLGMRSMQFIYEGMADGSIRQMDNPSLFMACLNETIFGILMRHFVRDHYYIESHREINMRIVRESSRILLESIRP